MQLSPQTLLQGGKYKIIEKIGQGGFGIAYRATHQGLQTEVCIKEFFYSDLCERAKDSSRITIISTSAEKIRLVDSLQKKFSKEAQRIAKFQHPNIVQVTDTFEENNTAYFVMEYLKGGSLDELLKREGVLSEQKAKALILPIIDAMDAVHKMDLLHLDIKPANIMLRQNQTAVLIDFGISKYLETANGITTTTPIGVSKGYAPLEQYGGSITDFSKATDVYSLCATIYIMVTGFTPPEPLQILTTGFKSPSDLRPQLSADFNAAILKGLSTKAVDRQQSMSQLKAELGDTKNEAQTDVPIIIKPADDGNTVLTEIKQVKSGLNAPPVKSKVSKLLSATLITAVGVVLLLNILIVVYSNIGLINKALHLYVGVNFHFELYYDKQIILLIGVANLTSIVYFVGIVFQWLLSLTLAFKTKSIVRKMPNNLVAQLIQIFAKANVSFTLLLSLLLFVSLSVTGILGTSKYYLGGKFVHVSATIIHAIGWLSIVCMLVSVVAMFKLWNKK